MRQVIITRVAVAVVGLFLLAAAHFVRMVTPARSDGSAAAVEAPPGGAALFVAHCASCHAADDLRTAFEDSSAARRLELERFLADHGDTGPDDDRLILDYLSGKFPRARE